MPQTNPYRKGSDRLTVDDEVDNRRSVDLSNTHRGVRAIQAKNQALAGAGVKPMRIPAARAIANDPRGALNGITAFKAETPDFMN
jgi:hypothetical protein